MSAPAGAPAAVGEPVSARAPDALGAPAAAGAPASRAPHPGRPAPVSLPRVLRRGWWLGGVVLLLALASAAFFTSRQTPVYRATTMVVVTPDGQVAETGELLRTLETLERRTILATFARIPMAPESRAAVAGRLQRDAAELRGYRIAGAVVPSTNIIRIDVDGPERRLTADVANAAAAHMRDEAASLYRIFTMRGLAAASPPGRPVHPDVRRNLLIAAILGSFGAALAMYALDRAAPAAGGR